MIEAVVKETQAIVGQTASRLQLFDEQGINLVALSRAGKRMTERLGDTKIAPGDVLLLQGALAVLPDRIAALGLLPLAERELRLGSVRRDFMPVSS